MVSRVLSLRLWIWKVSHICFMFLFSTNHGRLWTTGGISEIWKHVDIFVAKKSSKLGNAFRFVCFIKVENVKLLTWSLTYFGLITIKFSLHYLDLIGTEKFIETYMKSNKVYGCLLISISIRYSLYSCMILV